MSGQRLTLAELLEPIPATCGRCAGPATLYPGGLFCPRCSPAALESLLRDWRPPIRSARRAGQALVEFALVLPILLALFLGAAEIGLVGLRLALAQRAVDTMAERAALATLDDAFVADEADRAGCVGWSWTLAHPDGGSAPGDRVAASLVCTFASLTDPARSVSVGATAVIPAPTPSSPTPSPAPSGTP